jgi:sigma-B regulation protein RsbU (phosphoserine phosphatase)
VTFAVGSRDRGELELVAGAQHAHRLAEPSRLPTRRRRNSQSTVSPRRRPHNRVRAAAMEIRELYDHAACGLLVTDADGTIRVVNETFCRWTGFGRDELVGRRKLEELLTVGGRILHQSRWALLEKQGWVAEAKLDLVRADGEVKPMILNAVARSVAGTVRHEIAAFSAEDRHRYERELVEASRRAEELHTRSMETQRALVDVQTELDVQRRAAEERALLAEQMIGIVSHDLRNPLSTIQLSATVLKAQDLTPKQRNRVEAILRATSHGTRMIADLLDFTQARLGHGLRVDRAEIDPHAVVAQAVDDLRLAYPGRVLVLRTSGSGRAFVDAHRLAQLLGNLVRNAMTHGSPDGAVTVTSAIDERALTLSVHNAGAPIPAEQLPMLFEPMTRGKAGGEGIGLGLFIVREIARRHGGDVTARSSAEDGTTVEVVVPLQAPA